MTGQSDNVYHDLLQPVWGALKNQFDEDVKFIHYTSAFVAFEILDKKSIWMRNTDFMNDSSEVSYALVNIINALKSELLSKYITQVLEYAFESDSVEKDDFISTLIKLLNDHVKKSKLYISCFSLYKKEPDDETLTLVDEDCSGRLSMWRGYGSQDTGVAIVFNNKLGAKNLSPRKVTYANIEDFFDILKRILLLLTDEIKNTYSGVNAKFKKIKSDEESAKEKFINTIAVLLANEVFYIKHPAFHEEHECRIAMTDPIPEGYNFCLKQDVVIVSGIPQKIFKYLLCQNGNIYEHPDRQLESVLEKIIIGPCEHPELVAEAIKLKAKSSNVDLNDDSFAFCDIPLRKN